MNQICSLATILIKNNPRLTIKILVKVNYLYKNKVIKYLIDFNKTLDS